MDASDPESGPPPVACAACAHPLKPGGLFCAHCGHRTGDPPPRVEDTLLERLRRAEVEWREIRTVIVFYAVLLGVQAVTALVARLGGTEGRALLAGDVLMGAATAAAARRHRRALEGLFSAPGFGLRGYLALVPVGAAVFAFVCGFVSGMQALFGLPAADRMLSLQEEGFVWVFLLICVVPPVLEEVAFRGVVYGVLERYVGKGEALVLSSVGFAILHLSVLSLFTHVPLGLYFGWLRQRSGSLYPPMFAHFVHNGLAVANVYLGFFPSP
jgi:membrane protease YdiL (CAAX protease family)